MGLVCHTWELCYLCGGLGINCVLLVVGGELLVFSLWWVGNFPWIVCVDSSSPSSLVRNDRAGISFTSDSPTSSLFPRLLPSLQHKFFPSKGKDWRFCLHFLWSQSSGNTSGSISAMGEFPMALVWGSTIPKLKTESSLWIWERHLSPTS